MFLALQGRALLKAEHGSSEQKLDDVKRDKLDYGRARTSYLNRYLKPPNVRNQCKTQLKGLSYTEERPNVTSATQEFRATKQDDNRESLRQSNRGIS